MDRIAKEEVRSYFGRPEKYQLIDFCGAILGLFFLVKNFQHIRSKPLVLNIIGLSFASIMFYVHTCKFFWASNVEEVAFDMIGDKEKCKKKNILVSPC